ncbi:unnamed protein product [Adineta steineri]|nr:unnamed protein product [Adineta steineri]
MNSVYSLTSSNDEPEVNDLELQDMGIGDEKSPTMSKMKYEQDELSQQRRRKHAFLSTRAIRICLIVLLAFVVCGSIIGYSVYHISENYDTYAVEQQDENNDDNQNAQLPQLRSYSNYEKRNPSRVIGHIDLYFRRSVGGGSRRSLQRISFPVARYNHRQLPLKDSFISFMPWTSIFADRRSRNTFIYSRSSVYVIPPLINRYGKRFSIAELIAAGYASFYSNSKRPSENFDIITIYQPSPLSGSRIPKINPRTGGFTDGMHTNYGSFSSSRYEEQEINIAHDSESEEDEEEEKEENTKHYSSKDSYNSDERPQPPSRSRSRPRYRRPSRRPVHSTRSTRTTTRSTRTTKRSSTAVTTMKNCIGQPDIENSGKNALKRISIHKKKHRCDKNVKRNKCPHWDSSIIQQVLRQHSITPKIANLTLLDALLGSYWVALVTVGTPGQPFYVMIDTGATDFWVPGVACGDLCGGTHVFDADASSTY